ncbi:hypothetical protein [Dyella thiooxydans]|uniref:hypothetical protein n=1 Tax=Dyella thiooxydans TaxID=445710 RepID=UPI000B33D450|nr:hypothetical protein [Dyella thiooxydans]
MKQKPGLSDDLRTALAAARRSPGWNSRPPTVKRFELEACTLYVVPFRRWAYRRREKRADAWWNERNGIAGPT